MTTWRDLNKNLRAKVHLDPIPFLINLHSWTDFQYNLIYFYFC